MSPQATLVVQSLSVDDQPMVKGPVAAYTGGGPNRISVVPSSAKSSGDSSSPRMISLRV